MLNTASYLVKILLGQNPIPRIGFFVSLFFAGSWILSVWTHSCYFASMFHSWAPTVCHAWLMYTWWSSLYEVRSLYWACWFGQVMAMFIVTVTTPSKYKSIFFWGSLTLRVSPYVSLFVSTMLTVYCKVCNQVLIPVQERENHNGWGHCSFLQFFVFFKNSSECFIILLLKLSLV